MKRFFIVFCCCLFFLPCLIVISSASSADQNQDVLDICSHYNLDPDDIGFFLSFDDRGTVSTYVFMTEDLPSPFAFEWRTFTEGGIQSFKLYPTNVNFYRLRSGSFTSGHSSISFSRQIFSGLEPLDASNDILVYDGNRDPYFFFQVQQRLTILQLLPNSEAILTKILQILTLLVPSALAITSLIVSVVLLRRFSIRFAL